MAKRTEFHPSKYTPGPWTIQSAGPSGMEVGPFPEDFDTWHPTARNRCRGDFSVAYTLPRFYIDKPGQIPGEEDANVLLIAAAPDLYEALKMLWNAQSDGKSSEAWTAAAKALAKAEGK